VVFSPPACSVREASELFSDDLLEDVAIERPSTNTLITRDAQGIIQLQQISQ
jgi:hypothetical protein